MRIAICLSALLMLGGCASMRPSLDNFQPYVAIGDNAGDKDQFIRDLNRCETYARNYSKPFNKAEVGVATIKGATSNTAAGVAVIDPLALAGGALGGALTSIIKGYDLLGTQQQRVLIKCLDQLSATDHSFLSLDPN